MKSVSDAGALASVYRLPVAPPAPGEAQVLRFATPVIDLLSAQRLRAARRLELDPPPEGTAA